MSLPINLIFCFLTRRQLQYNKNSRASNYSLAFVSTMDSKNFYVMYLHFKEKKLTVGRTCTICSNQYWKDGDVVIDTIDKSLF